MRRGAALVVVVQLACLSAPPSESGPDPEPNCASFGDWDTESAPVLDGVDAVSPTVTADQLLLLYETIDGQIGIADRTAADRPFVPGEPTLLSALNSGESERNPTLSSNGLTVWFTRGPVDATELFVSHRGDRVEPFPLAEPVIGLDSLHPEGPDWWDAGEEIVYSTAAPDHEIAHASCSARDACSQVGLIEVGDGSNDRYPTIRGDGLEIVFSSEGGMFAARRLTETVAFEIYDPLDFAGDDPELSPDGTTLYYAESTRLWMTTRTCIDGQ